MILFDFMLKFPFVMFFFFSLFLEIWCIAFLVYLNWDSMAWPVIYSVCVNVFVLVFLLNWIRHQGNGMGCTVMMDMVMGWRSLSLHIGTVQISC